MRCLLEDYTKKLDTTWLPKPFRQLYMILSQQKREILLLLLLLLLLLFLTVY